MGLSAKKVEAINEPGMHADGQGLYLRVQAGGAKGWILRFQLRGKRREMGLGSYPGTTLAEARQRAVEASRLVAQGIDPIEARRAAQEAQEAGQRLAAQRQVTFAEVAAQYVDSQAAGWSNPKHVEQWRTTLATYCEGFGAKSVSELILDDVESALRPIWLEKTETATRLLQRIGKVLAYAADKGLCSHDVETWAARLRRRLPALPAKSKRVRHHPALPFATLPGFMTALRQSDAMGSRALEFAILCASRSGEVRGATWSEINFKTATWTIPAGRMKARVAHRVPLSRQALELLQALPRFKGTDLVFPGAGGGQLSDMTLTAWLRRNAWRDEAGEVVTQHGFRSTFREWAQGRFAQRTAEAALAHCDKDAVQAAYLRSDLLDDRRPMMQAWADHCDGVNVGNVVPIRAA